MKRPENYTIDPSILSRLRARREALGLSQRALASRLGTTQSGVSDLENSHRDLQVGTLARWAESVGMRLTVGLTEQATQEEAR